MTSNLGSRQLKILEQVLDLVPQLEIKARRIMKKELFKVH